MRQLSLELSEIVVKVLGQKLENVKPFYTEWLDCIQDIFIYRYRYVDVYILNI